MLKHFSVLLQPLQNSFLIFFVYMYVFSLSQYCNQVLPKEVSAIY